MKNVFPFFLSFKLCVIYELKTIIYGLTYISDEFMLIPFTDMASVTQNNFTHSSCKSHLSAKI